MTTAELTAQINRLPLADQRKVSDYVKELLTKRKTRHALTEDEYFDKYFPKYTVKDLLKIIDENDKEYKEGKSLSYEEVKAGWREKYGISI